MINCIINLYNFNHFTGLDPGKVKRSTESKTCWLHFLAHFSWNQYVIVGSPLEWCVLSMIYSRDTPFWSETLESCCGVWAIQMNELKSFSTHLCTPSPPPIWPSHMRARAHTHTPMCAPLHPPPSPHVCMHVCVSTYVRNTHVCVCTWAHCGLYYCCKCSGMHRTHTYAHSCSCIEMCTHIHKHKYTLTLWHMYVHTHTHKHTGRQKIETYLYRQEEQLFIIYL